MKIGIAVNPTSGRGRGKSFGEQARSIVSQYPVEVVDLSGTDAQDTIRRCRKACEDKSIDALLAVGGDGMVHVGVCAVAQTDVPLGIVAVGSGNDIAREFRLPIRNVASSVHQVMGCLFGGRIRPTDAMRVQTKDTDTFALAIVSAGIDADTNLRTNNLSWPKGNLRYIRALIQSVREYSPYGVRLRVDGKAISAPATLVSVANCRYFGGGLNVAPHASTNDGLLDVVTGKAPRLINLIPVVALLFLGRPDFNPYVHMTRGKEIWIENDPSQGGPAPIAMADGEVMGELPLKITCVPGAVKLLI